MAAGVGQEITPAIYRQNSQATPPYSCRRNAGHIPGLGAEHLHRLLATLEPLTPLLWELIREGYEANWYCWIASHATEHAFELDRPTLRRLLALPGDLWLDVYGDGEDDE